METVGGNLTHLTNGPSDSEVPKHGIVLIIMFWVIWCAVIVLTMVIIGMILLIVRKKNRANHRAHNVGSTSTGARLEEENREVIGLVKVVPDIHPDSPAQRTGDRPEDQSENHNSSQDKPSDPCRPGEQSVSNNRSPQDTQSDPSKPAQPTADKQPAHSPGFANNKAGPTCQNNEQVVVPSNDATSKGMSLHGETAQGQLKPKKSRRERILVAEGPSEGTQVYSRPEPTNTRETHQLLSSDTATKTTEIGAGTKKEKRVRELIMNPDSD